MKVLNLTNKTIKQPSGAPIGADRIGDEAGLPKSPGFGDNQTMDINGLERQIDRWMMKEETRKRFKAKYGALADQRLKETAAKLKRESLDDPFSGTAATVSATTGVDPVNDIRPIPTTPMANKKYRNAKYRRNK